MNVYLDPNQFDLATPDGVVTSIALVNETTAIANVAIEHISSQFVGFEIEPELVFFNIKSTLAQLGVDGRERSIALDRVHLRAEVEVQLNAIGPIAQAMLKLLTPGAIIGKLFAADPRRRVRDPDYLSRMFGRADRWGRPLLSLGGMTGTDDLLLDKIDGRTVAFLALQNGRVEYAPTIYGFLPTLAKALVSNAPMRDVLRLHQEWKPGRPNGIADGELLLTRTLPLHIRTVFARVVDSLLSPGYFHTSASVLQPDTTASGDIYELFGTSVLQ